MEREKTMFERALTGDYEIKDVFTNIERCKQISNQLKILDLIEPTKAFSNIVFSLSIFKFNNNLTSCNYI